MSAKTLQKITATQISKNGVQALATRPNSSAQYGQGGLSSTELKLWFDKFTTFLASKINEIQDALCGEENAGEYIRVLLDEQGIYNLNELVTSFINGDFADDVLKLYPNASAQTKQTLQTIINSIASNIATAFTDIAALDSGKLSKVTTTASYKRAYIIMPDGTQSTVLISESAVAGNIPLYNSNGQLCCAVPTSSEHASSKGYTDTQDLLLGSQIDLTIDSSTFKLKAKLKNFEGTVLSESSEIDLPLEQMIINGSYNSTTKKLSLTLRNNQDGVDNNTIEIDISSLISGLVAESRTVNGKPLSGNIVLTANDVGAYSTSETYSMEEIDQKEIYAHAAFWSEESEHARGYTKGGKIDKRFKEIDALLAAAGVSIETSLDTSNYHLTVSLKNRKGTTLSSGTIDLPIESLITNGSYANGVLTLTLQSGSVIPVDISSIISGLVPDNRTINGKALSSNITLTPEDIGAAAADDVYLKTETYSKEQTYSKTETNNKISGDIETASQNLKIAIEEEHQSVGYAYFSSESEKASGYIKGGPIDKQFKAIIERITTLENRE